MEREEAIYVCKKIQSRIPELSLQGMAIMESGAKNSLSSGYTINITGIEKDGKERIKKLIIEHPLEVNEGDNYLIIYTPIILKEEA